MNNLPVTGRRVPPSQRYSKTLPAVGTKFCDWTVIETNILKEEGHRSRPACRVRCRCGEEAVCRPTILRNGSSTRCRKCALELLSQKTMAYQNRTYPVIPIGAKFGWWTVIETGLRIGKIRAVRVRCRCRTEKTKTYFSLQNGQSSSCGCKNRERSFDAAWTALYGNIKRRGWEFHLTLSQVKIVSNLPCAYCGLEPSNIFRSRYFDPEKSRYIHDPSMDIPYSGVDRVDSGIGYIEGNVVPCCAGCNFAKNKLPLGDFLALIHRIRAHNPSVEGIHKLASSLFAGS